MSPLTTENDPQYDDPAEGKRKGLTGTPEWLLRVTIESLLIVSSILLALAVDQWRDSRHNRIVAQQALDVFNREMNKNLGRIEENLPYHTGLRDVVAGMAGDASRAPEVQTILEGLEPTVLLNTAWETALATGALTHINVGTVSALSLTYDLQQRFRDQMQRGLPRVIITASTTEGEKLSKIQETLVYLNELVRSEQELQSVYVEGLKVINPETATPDSTSITSG
jgi:hypothetical protein